MNEQTKRRLLGGSVILLLAALFLPRLFIDLDKDVSHDPPPEFVALKIRPAPPPSQEIEAKLDRLKENVQPQAESTAEGEKKRRSEPKDKAGGLDAVTFDESGIPVRWVVQVASLRGKEEAEKLKQQLAAKGFTTFTYAHKQQEDDIIYAVYVGPTLQRPKADRHKEEIDKLFKTDGRVRKWN